MKTLARGSVTDGLPHLHLKNLSLKSLVISSEALKKNPLKDPSERVNPILIPKGKTPKNGFPVVFVLAGLTGNGPAYLNLQSFKANLVEKIDQSLEKQESTRALFILVDADTFWGGSQFINSPHTGNYEDYIISELVPLIKKEFPVRKDPKYWCLAGGSSGGYGALHLGSRYPKIFGSIAALAPDCAFDLSLLPELYKSAPQLEKMGGALGLRKAILKEALTKVSNWHSIINVVAMASCYSHRTPQKKGDYIFPIDLHTGTLDQKIWSEWKRFDPLYFLPKRAKNLKKLHHLYLDVGHYDQYHLQFGSRQIKKLMKDLGVRLHYSEFEGSHFDLGKRRPEIWKWLKKVWRT